MNLSAYFPRIVSQWQHDAASERAQVLPGSLVFMDISGFTAMSERLARKGKIGAEEVTEVLDSSFASLLEAAYEEGGSLLKFGGDAMLLFFSDEHHESRACRAAIRMRDSLRAAGPWRTSAGAVRLRMSVGVHSGDVHMFLLGSSHKELLVTGPTVTRTVDMEAAANAGQIRVSEVTAAAIPQSCLKASADGGLLLVKAPPAPTGSRFAAPPQHEIPQAERFVSPAIREHLLATDSRESEHRQAVVCFVHFEGVDGLLTDGGTTAVTEALANLVEAVQQATDELDLCFLATDVDRDGGKIIITAGVPKTSGKDEEGMLRAVTKILASNQQLKLRIGVNAGPVFAGDVGLPYRRTYTVMGDAVNLAARLMAKAGHGQALTVPAVVNRSSIPFELTPLEPFSVKGKAKPVAAVALGGARGDRGLKEELQLPLIGRDQEMHLLLATLDAAGEGRRGIVELVGDAGIGKSRIVEELRERATSAEFHRTSCEQYESSTAYFPVRRLILSLLGLPSGGDPAFVAAALTEWVRANAPDLAEWLPLLAIPLDVTVPSTTTVDRVADRFRRAQIHRVFGEFLDKAAAGPTLFVIEDAQWIDDASHDLLTDVLTNTTGRPWLFLATRRPDDRTLFADIDEESVTIVLEPLRPAAAEELTIAAIGGAAVAQHQLSAVTGRAAGNPLFLRELAVAISAGGDADGLPDSVEALLAAQIDRLSGTNRRVLRYASVVGPTFNTQLLQESLGELLHGSAADACRALPEFLIAEGRDSYRFRHALVRETAYNGLPFRLRQKLHERLALNIERRHGRRAETRAELLSLHFYRAHRYDRALHYARLAGARAKTKSANVEAATLYRRAIDAARQTGGVPDEDRVRLHEALGDVCELAAMYDEAAEAFAQARRYEANSDGLCRLLRKEGVVRERLGNYSLALRWYGRALRYRDVARASEVHQLQLAYAGVKFRQGKYADCARWCQEVIPPAGATGDRASLAHAYYLLDHAYTMLGNTKAGEYRNLALPMFEELGDFLGQANVLNNLGVAATIEGDWDEALRLFERSRAARERVGDVVGAATATNNIGEVFLDRGRAQEAEPLFREALRIWRGANYAVGIAVATSALGLAAARSHRFAEAESLFTQALTAFEEMGAETFAIETLARMAELHLASGAAQEASTTIAETLPRSKANGMVALTACLFRLRAIALLEALKPDEARKAIDESVKLARSISASYELALSLLVLADIRKALGEDNRAPLAEGQRILKRLGVHGSALPVGIRALSGPPKGTALPAE